jgi:hypothetical protein
LMCCSSRPESGGVGRLWRNRSGVVGRWGVIDAGKDHGAGRVVGCCWSSPVGGHVAGPPARSGARDKGMRYPADPPTGEVCPRDAPRRRSRSRPALARADRRHVARRASHQRDTRVDRERFDADRGSVLVRHGKGDKRREVGMDQWGWELLRPWLAYRVQIPVGPLFCVIDGRTRGRPLTTTSVRQQLRRTGDGRCARAAGFTALTPCVAPELGDCGLHGQCSQRRRESRNRWR